MIKLDIKDITPCLRCIFSLIDCLANTIGLTTPLYYCFALSERNFRNSIPTIKITTLLLSNFIEAIDFDRSKMDLHRIVKV